ncbi:hypothetical protein PVAND_007790 [Polypedilum vanderplanki]|uniref:Otopetrin-2 n=1 Tax=Polypedilum vanderplanki TaxID=319348 RepID=A0A9J6C899_POLVA|nr:hypothetical protein PVAND_007790 [Polypedilum vanderplanki]
MPPVKNMIWNQTPHIVINDVDSITNHKSSSVYQKQLSIVEEGEKENLDSPTDRKDFKLSHENETRQSTPHSSAEHLPAITVNNKANRHYLSPDADYHEKEPLNSNNNNSNSSRRPSVQLLQDLLSSRRSSTIMAALRRPSLMLFRSKPEDPNDPANKPEAIEQRRKNRRIGNDALSTALSALYAKIVVIIGIALPITEVLSGRIPSTVYQGFYVYLYFISIAFVVFIYAAQLKNKAMMTVIKDYNEKTDSDYATQKKRAPHFGSFYLRVGAIAFGIGNMVYSGLELGQYFEIQNSENAACNNILMLLQPSLRMLLSIVQIQFIFLNTNDLDMGSHKVISRFGLMHMVATNLCEWLYTLIEETKHEIYHLGHDSHDNHSAHSASLHVDNYHHHNASEGLEIGHNLVKRSIINLIEKNQDCQRTNIMGSLVQNASPFLFPCTIEYSLICAVILFEMWKKVKSIPEINKARRNSLRIAQQHQNKSAYHFSIDCSKAQRGMFAGIVVIVLTIISLIMYFVLHDKHEYELLAIKEVTFYEILLYTVTGCAVLLAFFHMRDLKYHRPSANDHHADSVKLDCTLLVLAGLGVYVYGMFSIMGSVFAVQDDLPGSSEALLAEVLSLIQVSLQTLFVLNACWRRCRGAQQNRTKPGRQIITFLLVANISMWFINTLIKGHAAFRPSHLKFFGTWAWVVITHVSMPLAIFYRYHSTICLFDIWKSAYKVKTDH